MENSNKSKGELVYESLLLRDDIPKKVVDHPFFRERFIREYNLLQSSDNKPLEIGVSNDMVSFIRYQNLPNATNGIYTGYKDVCAVSFSVENSSYVNDENYLCVRRKDCSVFSLADYDRVCSEQSLEVYNDGLQLGKAHVMNSHNSSLRVEPYLDVFMPPINMAFAVAGTIDLTLKNKLEQSNDDFDMTYSGRRHADSGVVLSTSVVKRNGIYEMTRDYSAVNVGNRQYLPSRSSSFATYDDLNNKLVYLDSQYSSLDEAINAYNENYLESVEHSRNR